MRSTSSFRLLGLGLVVAGVIVAVALVLPSASPDRSDARDGASTPSGSPSERTAPLTVLRQWDRARAAAWREADPRALARLYVAGSRAGRADRGLLAAYAARGLRVTGMRMQVASVEVVTATDDRMVLVVTDRLVGAIALGRGARIRLPRDGWSRRRTVLVRTGEDWRVARVSDQVSMVASTDRTSGSANS